MCFCIGQKRAPKQGEEQAWNDNRRAEKQDKTESRPSFREYRSYETERQTEFTAERYVSYRETLGAL